jgi:hypothetical protein
LTTDDRIAIREEFAANERLALHPEPADVG